MQISGHEMGTYEYMHVHNIKWEDSDLDNYDENA